MGVNDRPWIEVNDDKQNDEGKPEWSNKTSEIFSHIRFKYPLSICFIFSPIAFVGFWKFINVPVVAGYDQVRYLTGDQIHIFWPDLPIGILPIVIPRSWPFQTGFQDLPKKQGVLWKDHVNPSQRSVGLHENNWSLDYHEQLYNPFLPPLDSNGFKPGIFVEILFF